MARRRTVLRAGLFVAVAALAVARPWTRWQEPEIAFAPLEGLSPFRVFTGSGSVSGGSMVDPMFVGLSAEARTEADTAREARLRAGLCDALLGGWAPGNPVPVTYFTDLRCVNCRALERNLEPLLIVGQPRIDLTTREFPVFGLGSELAAQAILAAGRQGAGAAEALRARLQRSAAVTSPSLLADHAAALGLDRARFEQDFDGAEVAARLAEDRTLARILGVPGTPALVIGRTLVIGAQTTALVERLVAQEAEEGPPSCA